MYSIVVTAWVLMRNTLLASTKLEHQPGHLMEVMVAETLHKLNAFTPQMYFHEACVGPHSVRPQLCQDTRQNCTERLEFQRIPAA